MKHRDRILVVTATLGDSRFLDKAVASVAGQALDIIHVISAPDKERGRLEARFPNARIVRDAGRTGGVYGAINAALWANPEGWDWFTYINDDDMLLPGFADVFNRHRQSFYPEPVVYGDVDLIDENDRCIARVAVEKDWRRLPALLQQGISPLNQQGMLFHRDLIERLGDFECRYRLCADLAFWLRAYADGSRFRYYPVRVAQFRIRAGQLSGDTAITRREQAEIVARYLPRPVPALERQWASLRFRADNLPRYLERIGSRGFKTSYQLLQGSGGEK